MATIGNYCFCLVYFYKSFPLKPHCQIKQNLTGSIYGRSSIRFSHLILNGQKTSHHRQFLFLIGWNLKKIFSSETRRHNELLLYRNNVWKILFKISIFCADHTTYMVAICSSWLWLADLEKSPLKPFGKINWNLVGSTYRSFCKKFPQNKMTGEQHSLILLSL
jgi:hypothetical protein